MDFDLRQLRHAHAVAAHRSFARAAKALSITQPALSRSIQMLEARLGTRLFDRNTAGVDLTDAGRLLLDKASTLLELADDLARKTASLRNSGNGYLSIGAGPYPTAMLLGNALAKIAAEMPGARVHVVDTDWSESIEMVRRCELAFVIAETSTVVDDPGFSVTGLARHQAYFVVRAGHPLTKVAASTVEEILAFPLALTERLPPRILDHLLDASRDKRGGGSAPREPSYACSSLEVLKRLVAQSDVVAPFPMSLIRDDVAAARLVALPSPPNWLHLQYGIIQPAYTRLSPLGEALARHLHLEDQRLAGSPEIALSAQIRTGISND